MAIFDIFAHQKRELSNSEMARLLGIAETSSLDLLHTLVEEGYLTRTLRTRRFYPTGRLLTVATKISENDPVFAVGSDAVEALVEMTGETALCGRLESGAVKVVAFREGQHELRYVEKVGSRIASHASALGKALLAAGTDQELVAHFARKPLKKITDNTITDTTELQRAIEQARTRGWAAVHGEGTEGVSALAVAGLVGDDCIGISLAGPTERFRRNEAVYLKALHEVKKAIFAGANPAPQPAVRKPRPVKA
jgi:DNA-binding IclR family transcriptional regulator